MYDWLIVCAESIFMNFVDSGIEVFILDAKTDDIKAIFEWNSGFFTIFSLEILSSLLVRWLHRLQEEKICFDWMRYRDV